MTSSSAMVAFRSAKVRSRPAALSRDGSKFCGIPADSCLFSMQAESPRNIIDKLSMCVLTLYSVSVATTLGGKLRNKQIEVIVEEQGQTAGEMHDRLHAFSVYRRSFMTAFSPTKLTSQAPPRIPTILKANPICQEA
ncbi:hypothetical protein [Rosistilla oblonga]|uniref:hypothetical protein n=1 Tax=Rosistilla oblonga TaxID=2527990 RepID=UPI003A97D70C